MQIEWDNNTVFDEYAIFDEVTQPQHAGMRTILDRHNVDYMIDPQWGFIFIARPLGTYIHSVLDDGAFDGDLDKFLSKINGTNV